MTPTLNDLIARGLMIPDPQARIRPWTVTAWLMDPIRSRYRTVRHCYTAGEALGKAVTDCYGYGHTVPSGVLWTVEPRMIP